MVRIVMFNCSFQGSFPAGGKTRKGRKGGRNISGYATSIQALANDASGVRKGMETMVSIVAPRDTADNAAYFMIQKSILPLCPPPIRGIGLLLTLIPTFPGKYYKFRKWISEFASMAHGRIMP
jgi:hypothetical protein